MGMFDRVKCYYSEMPDEHKELTYQSKSFECNLDDYKIEKDGSIWIETFDIEDQSDPKAEGILSLVGCMTRVNKKFKKLPHYTDKIRIYSEMPVDSKWLEYEITYDNGNIVSFVNVET